MDTSNSVIEEEEEEEEEEWSNNDTGWTKYFDSDGNGSGSAGNYVKKDENMEDDDSLASDASSGPAYEDREVKGQAKYWDDEMEEDHEKQDQEKNKFCKKDKKKAKEKEKTRSFIKL